MSDRQDDAELAQIDDILRTERQLIDTAISDLLAKGRWTYENESGSLHISLERTVLRNADLEFESTTSDGVSRSGHRKLHRRDLKDPFSSLSLYIAWRVAETRV